MSKPREFWIAEYNDANNVEYSIYVTKPNSISLGNVIHVREVDPDKDELFDEMLAAIKTAAEYLGIHVDCSKTCTPSENFHDHECCILTTFADIIRKAEGNQHE